MTSDTLQNALHGRPFRPFVLHLADDRSFRVSHPDAVAHLPGHRSAAVAFDGQYGGGTAHIDILLVTSLDFEDENGKPKRRREGRRG